AAEVRGAVEKVGVLRVRVAGARKPCLQQRRVGGDGDERHPDGYGEQAELPEIGVACRRLTPRLRQSDGKHDEGQQSYAEMHEAVRRRRYMAGQQVRVAVPDEQRGLKKQK